MVVFPPVSMSILPQNSGYIWHVLCTTGCVVAMLKKMFMILLKLQFVSLLFFCPFSCSYTDMRDSTRTLNRCLNVRQKVEFCSGELCVQTGSTSTTCRLSQNDQPVEGFCFRKTHLQPRRSSLHWVKKFCFLNIVSSED